MTPKEKALKICQEIGRTTLFYKEFNDGHTLPLEVAKKCATVCVDNIKERLGYIFDNEADHNVEYKYWSDVQAEIIKL